MSEQLNKNDTCNYILFDLDGTTYAINSEVVIQMEMVESITPVPNVPEYVEGVVLSRGQVIPVINLRKRFGFSTIEPTIKSRLIVVSVDERKIALLVDNSREFMKIQSQNILPPPEAIAGLSGKYLNGVYSIGERIILIFKVDEIVNLQEYNEKSII